jgi:hypothetical protein
MSKKSTMKKENCSHILPNLKIISKMITLAKKPFKVDLFLLKIQIISKKHFLFYLIKFEKKKFKIQLFFLKNLFNIY